MMDPNYSLTPDAHKALKKSRQDFINLCGDTYLAGEITGGEFMAVFNYAAATEAEEEKMAGSFNGAMMSNSVDASLAQKMQSYHESKTLDVEVIRKGPNEVMPNLRVPALIEYAENYPPKVAVGTGTPWTVSYVTLPYKEILDTSTLDAAQEVFLTANATYLRQLYARKSGLLFIASHKTSFAPFSSNRLDAEVGKLERMINEVRGAALACARNAKKCRKKIETDEIPPLPEHSDWANVTNLTT